MMAQRTHGSGSHLGGSGSAHGVMRDAVKRGGGEGRALEQQEGRRTGALPRSGLVVCRACSTAWGCKSPTQPDGGEVLAKRKGVAARRGLKEAWSEAAT